MSCELPGFLDLADLDVAQSDAIDVAVALQRRQRADAGGQRRPRVWRVELVEVDALDAERSPARLAGLDQMARPSVRLPRAVRPCESALGGHTNARPVPVPRVECPGDETLVVSGLSLVQAVGVSSVEERHAGVQGRVQDGDAATLVAIGVRGQTHATHAHERRVTGLPHAPASLDPKLAWVSEVAPAFQEPWGPRRDSPFVRRHSSAGSSNRLDRRSNFHAIRPWDVFGMNLLMTHKQASCIDHVELVSSMRSANRPHRKRSL